MILPEISRTDKFTEMECRLVVTVVGERGSGRALTGHGVFFWAYETVLELDRGGSYTTL